MVENNGNWDNQDGTDFSEKEIQHPTGSNPATRTISNWRNSVTVPNKDKEPAAGDQQQKRDGGIITR